MNIYWSSLIIVSTFAALAAFDRHFRKISYIFSIVVLIAISSIRYKTGYDFDNYVSIYETNSLADTSGTEVGWIAINQILKLISNSSFSIFIFSSLLIYGSISALLYRESKYAAIGMLAFLLNIPFYWESLSILRQYSAIALSLIAAFSWVKGRKNTFFTLTIFAILFHMTAIVTLLTPFLCKWRSRVILGLTSITTAAIASRFLGDLIFSFSTFEKYQLYLDGTIAAVGQESSGAVIYARAFCALLLVITLESIKNITRDKKNLTANSIILGQILFYILYESIALRRVAHFFIIYEIFAISYIAKYSIRGLPRHAILLRWSPIVIYLLLATTLLSKDVWLNTMGKQDNSQQNHEYRSIISR